jgi:hypothetical protein
MAKLPSGKFWSSAAACPGDSLSATADEPDSDNCKSIVKSCLGIILAVASKAVRTATYERWAVLDLYSETTSYHQDQFVDAISTSTGFFSEQRTRTKDSSSPIASRRNVKCGWLSPVANLLAGI